MAVLGYPTVLPHEKKAAERRLLRRLDFRVLPILWLLYLVSFIDRSNIGNAKIQGMDQELQLKGQRYNIALFVFNIGYLVAGIPLSIVFNKTGPKSLAVMMFCWGNSEPPSLVKAGLEYLLIPLCRRYRHWLRPDPKLGRPRDLPVT